MGEAERHWIMKHGTTGAYNRYGCRCKACKIAKATANNLMRKKRRLKERGFLIEATKIQKSKD